LEARSVRDEELAGNVALVTGAARGQGRAIVDRLVAAGADVVATDIDEAELATLADAHGDRVRIVGHDVRERADWVAAAALAEREFGRLTILVNNAGRLHAALIEHETPEAFEDVWRTNTLGPFLGIRVCAPILRRAGGGAIVNTASVSGLHAWTHRGAYCSSKFALRGLS
jgi:3alpha(or 20beta)-hydroxysteroid dehydrogenase